MNRVGYSDKEMVVNEQFDNWVREMIPAPRESEIKKEIHLAILKERLRNKAIERRGQRIRRGMVVVPFVLLTFFFGSTSELGGDGFDLVELDSPGIPGRIYENEFREEGFNLVSEDLPGKNEELNRQMAAGEGTVVGVEGFEINGKVEWSIKREYSVSGERLVLGFSPDSPSTGSPRELREFLLNEWSFYENQIEEGRLLPDGERIQKLDGIEFVVQYWEIPARNSGSVVYYSGKPIR